MFYNFGGLEVFYDWKRDAVEIPPRFIADVPGANINNHPTIKGIESVQPFLQEASRIFIVRRFAIGDVLMLIPIVRQLKDEYGEKHITLLTVYDIVHSGLVQLLHESVFDDIRPAESALQVPRWDLGVLLDGILEWDHVRPQFHNVPRVDIYRGFFSLDKKATVRWNVEEPAIGSRTGVVFCSGGRANLKRLPPDTADYIERKLKRKSRRVYHINDSRRLPTQELVDAIRKARVLITMDTAPLWIAHFTNTPVVFISGPTRGKERLVHHPLYPDGVVEVRLASGVCKDKPCYERMGECGGRVDCFRVPKQEVWERVEVAMEKVAWKMH